MPIYIGSRAVAVVTARDREGRGRASERRKRTSERASEPDVGRSVGRSTYHYTGSRSLLRCGVERRRQRRRRNHRRIARSLARSLTRSVGKASRGQPALNSGERAKIGFTIYVRSTYMEARTALAIRSTKKLKCAPLPTDSPVAAELRR